MTSENTMKVLEIQKDASWDLEFETTRALLKQLEDKIPGSLGSMDRIVFIHKEIISQISESTRVHLRLFFEKMLKHMRQTGASDIDLGGWGANGYPWIRVQGSKKQVQLFGRYSNNALDILIQNILSVNQRELLFRERSLDFSYVVKSEEGTIFRTRATVYLDLDALALNMRSINTEIMPFPSFGFHANIVRMMSMEHTREGLILVTGITGSGKSTTLDSIVDMNNQNFEGHVVIIASPVEFVHRSNKCLIRHREVGRDTRSFKQGTIEALRQDPDVIIIGEMRDPATIEASLEAADSGHKVLSTLHTSSAIESIDRIIGETPPSEQERLRNRLADVLRCVISQKLVPSKDGKRVLAKEVMIVTSSVKAAIKNNNTGEIYQMISEGQKYGMSTMEQDLKQLVMQRKINPQTAMSFANNKRMMQQLLQPY
ncbi:PilT/PilU family type 4a pilus ATPase [bacterium]|nr:PilT/PilU family type 4a pilus ATPase [bacterium]